MKDDDSGMMGRDDGCDDDGGDDAVPSISKFHCIYRFDSMDDQMQLEICGNRRNYL